ncbi:unnamed protein product [Phytophthora fragariaefolia]|uniref:Unnamed protein product n=1 Tax=Phytophthora fragariaefolia TaxID=1490495 RepID=A0A9W6WVU1_9STRA|nr:unnamed protein product [Phytophthora fragariaefolia]
MQTKQTITTRGTKTVWVKCANKDKTRATAMLLADWDGNKYPPFLMFKSSPAVTQTKRDANSSELNGFWTTVWREVSALQKETNCQIYGNKCAWWNLAMSLKFHDGHWTTEVVDYAAPLNVILLKVPPKYTYVCQLADVSWNKPFKSGLRSLWIKRLRGQLAGYRAGEKHRDRKRAKLEQDIIRARKELVQAEADEEVNRLLSEHGEEPFKLKAPNRVNIARWVASCWDALIPATIRSGFRRGGLLDDPRYRGEEVASDSIETRIV